MPEITSQSTVKDIDYQQLAKKIKAHAKTLGMQQCAITDTQLDQYANHLRSWLGKQYHGTMHYMARNMELRTNPSALLPNTKSVIMTTLNYLPPKTRRIKTLNTPGKAYISRYALGRDYHKLIRKRMAQLARFIATETGMDFNWRPFADSAPVMEKPLAEKAGLGWIGKNTLLLNRTAGSWFFLGTLFTDLPLPSDPATTRDHCGTCTACIDICPTNAIVAPYQLDARRCISYLTIEHRGSIPEQLRPLIGNRIFGCDDCQLVCPWNRFAKFTDEDAFHPRHHLDDATLIELFQWSEAMYLEKTQGSALRRIGYSGWLRNIAVALGNAPTTKEILAALHSRNKHPDPLVQEHVMWALRQHKAN